MFANTNKVGLALSGGGYRAVAFHLGTLKKLNEMGLLQHVDIISAISGGAITGACYCIREGDFNRFYQDIYLGLQTKNVIRRVIFSWFGLRVMLLIIIFLGSFYSLFTPFPYPLLFPILIAAIIILIIKFQFWIFPISKRIEEIFNQFFFENKTLIALPEHPVLVIGATNLQTARPFIFSRERMTDSTYEFSENPVNFNATNFPIARSVMASCCIPFAFTPVTIEKEYFSQATKVGNIRPLLIDGGVYDNQGIHKIMQKGQYECHTVIVSDAGSGSTIEQKFNNTLSLLSETANIFMSRIKKTQMVLDIYDNASKLKKEISYFSLAWDFEKCIPGFYQNLLKHQIPQSVLDSHKFKAEWIAEPIKYEIEIITHLEEKTGYASINYPTNEEKNMARKVKTSLSSLNKINIDCLVKQAEALAELQIKLYCPSLLRI